MKMTSINEEGFCGERMFLIQHKKSGEYRKSASGGYKFTSTPQFHNLAAIRGMMPSFHSGPDTSWSMNIFKFFDTFKVMVYVIGGDIVCTYEDVNDFYHAFPYTVKKTHHKALKYLSAKGKS